MRYSFVTLLLAACVSPAAFADDEAGTASPDWMPPFQRDEDALKVLTEIDSLTGDIPLSGCLDDAGEVFLAKREGGSWKYYSRADRAIPSGPASLQHKTAASQPAASAK